MFRVFVAVFYCGILTAWCYLAAAVIFLLAAATDALDGHIARSRNLVTNLGKFLDPIADKVLVSTAFIILLTIPTAFDAPPEFGDNILRVVAGICVALILARELIVSGFRMIAAGKNVVLAADKFGKIKTVFQDIAIAFLLASMTFLTIGAMNPGYAYIPEVAQRLNALFNCGLILDYIGLVCFVICTILTVVSGVNYIVKNKQVLKDAD